MDLWIGNATRQIYHFNYRVPDVAQPRTLRLDPGRQDRIRDLTTEEVDFIVKNHLIYGLIPQDEIDQTQEFHGTCYAVDKPITAQRFSYLLDRNLDELVERGRTIRRENAVAQTMTINQHLSESGRPERVQAMDMTVQQERQDPNNEVPQMSVGIMVTEDEGRPPPSQGRPRRVA